MPCPIRSIVVGVASLDDQDPRSGAGDADPVLAPAIRLAAGLGAELHVVHAYEVPEAPDGPAEPRSGDAYQARMLAGAVEERLEAQAAALPGGDTVHCHAVEGSAAASLVRVAKEVEAGLLVVGASRRAPVWSGILGSTAGQVLAGTPIPVLVVHRPFGTTVRRVLLTTDLTAAGAEALGRARELVGALFGVGAPVLRCLHVVYQDTLLPERRGAPALQAAGQERLGRFLAGAGLDGVVEERVRVGDPAREIAYEALEWPADLLVVAAHAHPGQRQRPLGSVAFAAVRGAPCNVLVLPAAGAGVAPTPPRTRVAEPSLVSR